MDSLDGKVRVATAWLGGCSGCHMSLLDMDERLLDLAGRIELCASPLTDCKDFPPVDVALVEGAVANEEHLAQIRRIRANARVLVSFGDCAVTGNVPAMRNAYGIDDVLNEAYRTNTAVIVGVPEGNAVVPRLLARVRPVHEVVPVDLFLQGCPPEADAIYELLTALLDGRRPALEGRRFG